MLVHLGQGPGNGRVALGTQLGRVTFQENVRIFSRKLWKRYMDLQDNFCGRLEDWQRGYRHKRTKLPYLGNLAIMPMGLSYPTEESKLPYIHRQSHPRT